MGQFTRGYVWRLQSSISSPVFLHKFLSTRKRGKSLGHGKTRRKQPGCHRPCSSCNHSRLTAVCSLVDGWKPAQSSLRSPSHLDRTTKKKTSLKYWNHQPLITFDITMAMGQNWVPLKIILQIVVPNLVVPNTNMLLIFSGTILLIRVQSLN